MTAYPEITPYESYARTRPQNSQALRGTKEGDRHYHKAPKQASPPVRIPPNRLGSDEEAQLSELHLDSVGVASKPKANGLKLKPQRKLINPKL